MPVGLSRRRCARLGTYSVALSVLASSVAGNGVSASEYYIDNAHPNASDSNAGTETLPWRTITKANQTLHPGDTVYIKEGVYNQFISPERSGSAANRIVYRNFGTDNVQVTGTTKAVALNGKSYITVEGLNFWQLDRYLDISSSDHITIAYCTFNQMPGVYSGVWTGSRFRDSSQYNWIHHCVFANYGFQDPSKPDDKGAVFEVGDEYSHTDHSDYNLIESNVMYHGGHHVVGLFGRHNVFRDNYIHNENWHNGFGNRCVYTHGYDESSGSNLIEGNRIAFSGQPPDNNTAAGMGLVTKSNIVRFNSFYHNGGDGLIIATLSSYFTSPTHNRVYHNTFYKNGLHNPSHPGVEACGLGMANWGNPTPVAGNVIMNNLFHRNPAAIRTDGVSLASQVVAGNFLEVGDPLFVDVASPLYPTNGVLPDLNLRSGSPCIDQGVFLTSVTSPDGSGRSLQLADPSVFMDGWGIVQGDLIQLQGSLQQARIAAIDLTTRIVTVGSDLTWTQGQGMALAYEGSGPDVGAFEYAAGGAPTNPVISIAPSRIDFGSVGVGSTNDQILEVRNIGGGTLTGTASVSAPFSIVGSSSYSLGSNDSTMVTVRYWPGAAGDHSGTITFTGGGGASAAVTGLAKGPLGASFEASEGVITSPFTINGNGTVSQSVETLDPASGGRAGYLFAITNAGDYVVFISVSALAGGANSVFVNIDSEPISPDHIWDVPVNPGFVTSPVTLRDSGGVPKVWTLTSGLHTLIIRGREAGCSLSYISIEGIADGRPAPPTNLHIVSP